MCDNSRGQGMIIDLMAAFLIFVTIAGSIMWAWDYKVTNAENRLFESERFAMAEKTLDTLIRSKGLPENWEEGSIENIQAVGIAKRDLVIDPAKAEKFKEFSTYDSDPLTPDNYDVLRTKLLIGGNDYYFRIIDPENGNLANAGGEGFEAGKCPKERNICPDPTLAVIGNFYMVTAKRPVIFTYQRECVDPSCIGDKQYEAIAELTLYSTWQWRQ